MKFKIPKTFELLSHTYTIRFDDKQMMKDGNLGEATLSEKKIVLAETSNGNDLPPNVKIETFFHELTHAIFYEIGETEMSKNEKLVSLFSGLLTQAILSMKGGE